METEIVTLPQTKQKLIKCSTGIKGLDEITYGGLPQGRPTLICGNAGCGKTLISMEFIVNGAKQYDEPGVFISFEETSEDLIANFNSLGFDLEELMESKKIALEFVYIERSEIEETGEYDLDGLFLMIGNAIDSIGAKRVVLDTLEALFSGFSNEAILRAELRRLFRFLKDRGVTAIITGERGEKMMTKYGLEEYVADCVIMLDHRVTDQISTRRLKIIKYRGSQHGSNEYPFLVDDKGGCILDVKAMMIRILDFMKMKQITALMTDLSVNPTYNDTEIGISSMTDTWIRLINEEKNRKLIRTVNIIKSRGMKHSNSITEFIISDTGVNLLNDNSTKN